MYLDIDLLSVIPKTLRIKAAPHVAIGRWTLSAIGKVNHKKKNVSRASLRGHLVWPVSFLPISVILNRIDMNINNQQNFYKMMPVSQFSFVV